MTEQDAKASPHVVDEATDDRVSSLSLSLTFVALGVVLALFPSFFGSQSVTTIVQWIFIVFGVFGFLSSFGDKNAEIKGSKDIGAGIILLAIGLCLFMWVPSPWNGIASILLFLFGFYGTIRGILFLLVTSWKAFKTSNRAEGASKGIFVLLEVATKLAALAVVVLQMVNLQS